MNMRHTLSIMIATLLFIGCSPAPLEEIDDKNEAFKVAPNSTSAAMTDNEFNSLTPEEQYQVANKLMGTLYKGIPISEYFDMTAGLEKLRPKSTSFITDTIKKLQVRVENRDAYSTLINEKYEFNEARKPMAEPLAAIHELPLSRDLFEIWMAYTLANTIMFSPAEEIDSTSEVDVQKVHSGLARAMANDVSIRQIVLTHMKSEANWRRFRSPEDNTREMIEIFLGYFDKDEDVPKASKACKNWYLTDDTQQYQLVIDLLNENTEPQQVLGEWVTTCDDFYELVANHEQVIPRVTTVLVDHFFPNMDSETRAEIVKSIVDSNPTHFEHIFVAMLFSKQYLLVNERPKRFEETYFNTGERVYWKPSRRFFDQLNQGQDSDQLTMAKMGQPAMSLKLGRWKNQPLDSLSFAVYHQAVREKLLIIRITDELNIGTPGWTSEFIEGAGFLTGDDYIQYHFLSLLARRASDKELETLNAFIEKKRYTNDKPKKTLVVLDYLSRLPELYYFNKVKDIDANNTAEPEITEATTNSQ